MHYAMQGIDPKNEEQVARGEPFREKETTVAESQQEEEVKSPAIVQNLTVARLLSNESN